MKGEKISVKAVVLWEVLAAAAAPLVTGLAVWNLAPGTWLWYTVLWLLGAVYILVSFLYLPLLYLSKRFFVGEETLVYQSGLLFPKTQIMYRSRIVFVTVYTNPLTPLLHISSLVISAAGGAMRIHFLNASRAEELAALLSERQVHTE